MLGAEVPAWNTYVNPPEELPPLPVPPEEETKLSTYAFVAASLSAVGVIKLVILLPFILIAPYIVPPARGKASVVVELPPPPEPVPPEDELSSVSIHILEVSAGASVPT